MFYTLKNGSTIQEFLYEDKGLLKFSDSKFRGAMEINQQNLRTYKNDFMFFLDGRWRQINEDELLKIIKRDITRFSPTLSYSDVQFKRIIDIINSSIDEFPEIDEIYNIKTDGYYKVIFSDKVVYFRYDDEKLDITIDKNIGQFYNFVSLGNCSLNMEQIKNTKMDDYHVGNEKIDTFLKEFTVNDESMIKFLQEIAGYCMLYGFIEPYIYIGTGKGGNGKSVFASLLKNLLGVRNIMATEYSSLNLQTVATLEKSFLNMPTELSGNKMLPENLLKAITDGEPTMANEKYREPRTIYPISKQFAMANELPPITDASDGFWRRALVIPFDLKVSTSSKKRKDKNFFEKLFKENNHLLQEWAFKGLMRLVKQKGRHTFCDRVLQASKKYQRDNNNVLEFVDEFISQHIVKLFNTNNILSKQNMMIDYKSTTIPFFVAGNGEDSIAILDLYRGYRLWSTEQGYKTVSSKNFKKKLEEKASTNYFKFMYEVRNSSNVAKLFFNESDFISINQSFKEQEKNELDNI